MKTTGREEILESNRMICDICGNKLNNKLIYVKERQLNKDEMFAYSYCSKCGTLQLCNKPEDISNYYDKNYYSFYLKPSNKKISLLVRRTLGKIVINDKYSLPFLLQAVLRIYMSTIMKLYNTNIEEDESILDIGGGNGKWLYRLREWGFHDLTCVDRFCDISNYNGVYFLKSDVLEIPENRTYKFISLHHSFEHMDCPDKVLKKLYRLLDKKGLLLIRIPVCGSEVWDRYKENWYQIDAPRHYYLYSVDAIKIMCKQNGFIVKDVIYDSNFSQFAYSKMYESTAFSLEEISENSKRIEWRYIFDVARVNKYRVGDQAAFYIVKA